MRACGKDIRTKRIKTTNIIDTVSSKVQNNFTNEETETRQHPHGVHHSARCTPAHARLLPNRVRVVPRGRKARDSATLLDLRRGGDLATRGSCSAVRGRFPSIFRFSGFSSVAGLGEGASQSGHAHSVWKISASFTLRGVSSVAPSENGWVRVSMSVFLVVSSIDNECWRSTMDRNGGPSCRSDRR